VRSMRLLSAQSVLSIAGLSAAAAVVTFAPSVKAASSSYASSKPSCADLPTCTEVANPQEAFGNYYVGHDEPSTEFYSNVPGSGNHNQYQLTIPTEPTVPYSNSNGYNFELHPAFWFGMAMCDTFSFPEQLSTCTPDSDSNIVNPALTKKGPGVAFMELQFYPPGGIPQFAGSSCDATKWCVALNIDSLSEDPINGKLLNSSCQSRILGGVEYINFAFLTLDGKPLGPPNPLQFNPSTSGNPANADTFFLNQGDHASVTLTDSPAGFTTLVHDTTTGQTGSMVASAANLFGHLKFIPSGHSCQMVPYTFHPMYSTSSPATRVLWAAHTYNVAFSDEIGHFDFCTTINADTGSCSGLEGVPGDQEPADGDDNACFGSELSLLYPATGCFDTNTPGFDGVPYHKSFWPGGTSLTTPGTSTTTTPILFSSPKTGADFSTAFPQFAFETDLPRIEAADLGGICNRTTGVGCVNPPATDDGTSAFYPYFSTVTTTSGCNFGLGATLPSTIDNFGGSSTAEYGPLLFSTYWLFGGHGATTVRTNNNNSGARTLTC
jgi:hypothetical protein